MDSIPGLLMVRPLSSEWVIQNHGDIAACVAVFFVLGLMFQSTKRAANYFIALPYAQVTNDKESTETSVQAPAAVSEFDRAVNLGAGTFARQQPVSQPTNETIYHYVGVQDIATLIFYTTLIIVWHAALQEYVFDKCVRRLNLSKTRTHKFSEMGQLFVWYVLNAAWGTSLCFNFGFFGKPSRLCEEWPHDLISWEAKLFYIFQISFWLHQYPELYLQRVRSEDVPNRVTYSTLYLIFTALPYSLGFWKAGLMFINLHYIGEAFISGHNVLSSIQFFKRVLGTLIVNRSATEHMSAISSLVFVFIRVVSLALTVIVFHFGFGHQPTVGWNTWHTRALALAIVSLVQIYQMWLFLGNRVKKWRGKRE